MDVAFLGLGRMGIALATHVARAEHHTLTVWNRSPGKAGPLVDLGAREAGSVADAVRDADVVVLMLFGPEACDEVAAELLPAARAGTLVVNASTVGPAYARSFGERCSRAGLRPVDAPVTGSVGPAEKGELGVLVGADAPDYEAVRPLLALWGAAEKIRLLGPVGTGSAMKLVINDTLGTTMAALGEALRLADDLGLREQDAFAVLGTGPLGWTLAQKQQLLADRDTSHPAFALAALLKDLRLASEQGAHTMPLTAAALEIGAAATRAGMGGDDYTALALHQLTDG